MRSFSSPRFTEAKQRPPSKKIFRVHKTRARQHGVQESRYQTVLRIATAIERGAASRRTYEWCTEVVETERWEVLDSKSHEEYELQGCRVKWIIQPYTVYVYEGDQ